jgi:hypothetical protein
MFKLDNAAPSVIHAFRLLPPVSLSFSLFLFFLLTSPQAQIGILDPPGLRILFPSQTGGLIPVIVIGLTGIAVSAL